MLLANVSTTSFVPDAHRLAIKMTHARKLSNVLTTMKTIHRIIKKCSVYNHGYYIQYIRVSKNVSFFEARSIYPKTHGQRVMNYAGAAKASIQSTSICAQTDVSWVGTQPVTSRPVPSVSRSVDTTTRVADVKKTVALAKSSPPKKDPKSSKPSSPQQQVSPVHESYLFYHRNKQGEM